MKQMMRVTAVSLILLAACRNRPVWRDDLDVQQAETVCAGLAEAQQYQCIEDQAVAALNPDVCRLANKFIDDLCLQMVYEAADDPAVCDQLYLESIRPNCEAFYETQKGEN